MKEIQQEEKQMETKDESSGVNRRQFIKTAGVIAGVGVTATMGLPAFVRASSTKSGPIKLGLLEDRSGNFALFGIPKHHGTLLAAKEINEGYTLAGGPTGPGGMGALGRAAAKSPVVNAKDGIKNSGGALQDVGVIFNDSDEILVESGEKGILGRELKVLDPDPQSDNRRFQSLTNRLILDEKVDVMMAAFASAEREAIRPIMDKNKQLYFYNNQYEGGVADKYTFCTGAVAEQQIIPAMEYCVANFGPRFYILAADYNFGQLSAMWSRAFAPVIGAQVVGQEFIPLSVSQFSSTIARVQKAKPDWMMMYITGENHSNFYPQANAAGVKIPMGSSINMAQGYEHTRFSPPALSGMHVAVNYMEEIPTNRNQAFVKRWRKMFPDEPYISQQAQNAYIATHLYAKAVRIAETTDQAQVIEALESGLGMEAPEGWVFMDPATHHLSHYIRIASCDDQHNISFVKEWTYIEPWWTRRLGTNLVRYPEFKQYTPAEDPYFKKALKS
jgi:branched-chain amino acid transport system substrate-binding protein